MKQLVKYVVGCLLASIVVGSASSAYQVSLAIDGTPDVAQRVLPQLPDSLRKGQPVVAKIHMLARTYGDSIVLRWAGEDYVTQQSLYRSGVTIYRIDSEGRIDSLVGDFKPWTVDELRSAYPLSDSIAVMAMELMSGKRMQPDQTRNFPGTMGALLEMHDDQQTRFGFSVLLSEWRPDLADKMAMRWVDRDVKPGETYEYTLQPSHRNPKDNLLIGAGHVQSVVNNPHTREELDVMMGDSITGPLATRLWWYGTDYSCFELERRAEGDSDWTRVNDRPILFFNTNGDEAKDITCSDYVPEPGRYYYRVMAHDAFGDLTRPSKPYMVTMPDLAGPNSPVIESIVIDRHDENDLSKDVTATFHISCDSVVPDFDYYMPVYFHKQITNGEWRRLSEQHYSATDTVFTIDVTGLSTGMVAVGAVDKTGNVSYSMPTLLALKDMKSPDAPRNLKAYTNAKTGTVKLVWECDEDDVEYFEVQAANDTTHQFMNVTKSKNVDRFFVDTLDMEVNQKYIYYRVRAIDYSTNEGEFTPVLAVVRPSILPPSPAHLETSSVEPDGIHMRWGLGDDQQNNFHLLVRKAEGDEKWIVIRRWEADSLVGTDHMVDVIDCPKFNRNHNYVYGVTSVALNGLTTISMLVSFDYSGPTYFEHKCSIQGTYDTHQRRAIVYYEPVTDLPYADDDWVYTIYRKRQGESDFTFYKSVPNTDTECFDPYLSEGEEAQYYMFIQYPDGCRGYPSNTVTIKALPR